MHISEIINKLKKLNLTSYPEKEVEILLKKLFQNPIPIVTIDYRHPKEIERAVNNTKDEPIFNSKNRISFKPKEHNKTYQRASSPSNTMFYASVIPENELSENEIQYARITGAKEVVDLFRENIDGERIVTFGKWEIQGLISVTTIFDPNVDYKIAYINEVKEFYQKQKLSYEQIEQRDEVLAFLAKEFSKKVEKDNNHEYLISAITTELIVNHNSDGVLYPSVQANGYGLCLALHPRVMDRLKLIKVLQCKIKKERDDESIQNEKFCKIEDETDYFQLKETT